MEEEREEKGVGERAAPAERRGGGAASWVVGCEGWV